MLKRTVSGLAVVMALIGAAGLPADARSWGSFFESLDSDVGRWILVAGGMASLMLVELGPKIRKGHIATGSDESSDSPTRGAPAPTPRQSAFRMLDELRRGRGLVATALEEGSWWNTSSDGIHDEEWRSGQDAMAKTVPQLRAVVGAAYADGVRLNREANAANSQNGPGPQFDAAVRRRLEGLGVTLDSAMDALREYCEGKPSSPKQDSIKKLSRGPIAATSPVSPPPLRPTTVLAGLRDARSDGALLLRAAREPLGGYATTGRVVDDHTVRSWEANVKDLLRDDGSRLSLFLYEPLAPQQLFRVNIVEILAGSRRIKHLERRLTQLDKVIASY